MADQVITRRTRNKAMEELGINLPVYRGYTGVPSLPEWNHTLKIGKADAESGLAYIVPLLSQFRVESTDGTKVYWDGKLVEDVDLESIRDHDPHYDFATLWVLYGLILRYIEEGIKNGTIQEAGGVRFGAYYMYLPDFAEKIYGIRNLNRAKYDALVDVLRSFQNLVGVVYKQKPNSIKDYYDTYYRDQFSIMHVKEYYESTNTVLFEASYLNMVAFRILKESIAKNKYGIIETTRSGQPILTVSHKYLWKDGFAAHAARNEYTPIICDIIMDIMVQAGSQDRVIKIRPSEIFRRYPEFEKAYNQIADASHANRFLKRTYTLVWDLLANYTALDEVFKNLVLPNWTPTKKTLDTSFIIKHGGKYTKKEKEAKVTAVAENSTGHEE